MTSNVSLDAARTIASGTDRNITDLIVLQVGLGILGLLTSLLLAWALISATRRQTAHFRSLVTSSTDLVLVLGDGGCRYASQSVTSMLGRPDGELLGEGFCGLRAPDDVATRARDLRRGRPAERDGVPACRNSFGEMRVLEAHITDLRQDRRIKGVVLNARDITERVLLEDELTRQAFHDGLTSLAEPRALPRPARPVARARGALGGDGLRAPHRPRRLQAGQRHARPRRRRPPARRRSAQRFDDTSRPGDTLARLGGDEFALLLEDADERDGIGVAQRMLERLAEPVDVAGHQLTLGASIGIVSHRARRRATT